MAVGEINAASNSESRARSALAVVGATEDELFELLGTVIEAAPCYLVGSLAAGYGNSRSDVDVHTFDPSTETGGAPVMYFIRDTIVDVVNFPTDAPGTLASHLPATSVPRAGGLIGLGTTLARKHLSRLGRWATAVPLNGEQLLLEPSLGPQLAAAAGRGAYVQLLRVLALAELSTKSQPSDAGAAAYRKAGRALADVCATSRGQVFVGRKWTWAKVSAAGVSDEVSTAADAARTLHDICRLADRVDLPIASPTTALDVQIVKDLEGRQIGGREFTIVGHQRAVAGSAPATRMSLGQALADHGSETLLRLIGLGAVELIPDDPAIDGVLE